MNHRKIARRIGIVLNVVANVLVFWVCGEVFAEVGTAGAAVVAACAAWIQIQVWLLTDERAQKGDG